jgi:MFS family permease
MVGTEVGVLALALVAIESLHVSSVQLGVIGALRYLPFLLLAVPAGLVVERADRRRLMILADLARAAVAVSVPVMYALGLLDVWWLYGAAFAMGALELVFDAAYLSFVPQLVGRDGLMRANRNLQASRSAAQFGGPAAGGVICGAIGAATALLVDACSFLVSAVSLRLIATPATASGAEPADPARARSRSRRALVGWWAEAREGMAFVLRDAELRALAAETAIFNACERGLLVIYLVYAVRELDFSAGLLGLSLAGAGVGSLLGTALAEPAARRFGLGPTIVVGSIIGGGAYLLIPAASGPGNVVFALVCIAFVSSGIATGISNVLQVSLRQASTPDALMGRMNASFSFIGWGTLPIGAAVGGALGSVLGLHEALWIVTAFLMLAPLAIVCSPLPRRRGLPTP